MSDKILISIDQRYCHRIMLLGDGHFVHISQLASVVLCISGEHIVLYESIGVLCVCSGSMGKRLEGIGVENTEENRRQYRELLFTSDKNLGKHISGVIMFHETIYQKDSNGTAFVDLLKARGIIPGIKVDKGVVPLAGSFNECTTQGRCYVMSIVLLTIPSSQHSQTMPFLHITYTRGLITLIAGCLHDLSFV